MNYQHRYHAGHFADVFKHCVLMALFNAFFQKDKPITYMETHAGPGRYDLAGLASQRTKAYELGIGKLYGLPHMPTIVADYCQLISAHNPTSPIRWYLGSPAIAAHLLRPDDTAILCEREPGAYHELKQLFFRQKEIAVHNQDGYLMLKALLPPKTRRGFVLIDPPYESVNEINDLIAGLRAGLSRWARGSFLIWYPIKKDGKQGEIRKALFALQIPALKIELSVTRNPIDNELIGSGLCLLNPPWQFEKILASFVPWLCAQLAWDSTAHYCIAPLLR